MRPFLTARFSVTRPQRPEPKPGVKDIAPYVPGKPIDEVKKFTAQDMLELFGARLTPNRQKCCLLSWRVLQAAIFSPVEGK
jgi:hypothetical protein